MHKVQKENKIASLKKAQDKSYIKYFWKAAKDIPNGTFMSQMVTHHSVKSQRTNSTLKGIKTVH